MPPPILQAGLETALRDRPLVALPLLFVAGVATSFLPCIYPMIPITAGLLSGVGGAARSRRRAVLATALYVTGLALVYSLLGLLAGLTGTIFGAVSANPWAYFVMGNLLLVFGLALLDVFRFEAPGRVLAWAGRLGADSYWGIFLLGATSGLVAAPCGAPAFAAVLTFVAATQSALLGFVYLLVFSLGMTTLLVVIGLVAGAAGTLPRSGVWMVWVKRLGGVLLLAMAEYYFVRMGTVL
ncbi:MAG TPA: cytochrome c biogenesis protein CcdA [Gemmatimonadales bacterium]|nr:cytochrome c biogenesis protein CcdA [Gemmatimonadales bacterium]